MNALMTNVAITDYDMANLLTYARILDAVRFDQPWDEAAAEILGLDVDSDTYGALGIWSAHVDRANWLVGGGLAAIADGQKHLQYLIH